MLTVGPWILDGVASLELEGAPDLVWTLSKSYASAEACFAETQTFSHPTSTRIEIDVHPKEGGIRVSRLSIRWQLPAGVMPPAEALRTLALTPGPDPLMLWSEREEEAPTHLRFESPTTLVLEREYGLLPLLHSWPALRLYIGPLSSCTPLALAHTAGERHRAVLVSPRWLEDDARALRTLIDAPQWRGMGVNSLVLDARISLSAPLSEAGVRREWQAFAKTCFEAGLRAGVTAQPQFWSERGHGYRIDGREARLSTPAWVTEKPSRWGPILGETVSEPDFSQQQARDALTQWLLWCKDLGFSRIDVLGLSPPPQIETRGRLQAHLSLMSFLIILRDEGRGLERYVNAELPPELAVDYFAGQSSFRPDSRALAPTWWWPRVRKLALQTAIPHAISIQDPREVILARLGVRSENLDRAKDVLAHLGTPPAWPLPPPLPKKRLRMHLTKWRVRFATELVEAPAQEPETWPPPSMWRELRQALSS